jgi:hypothetical protein
LAVSVLATLLPLTSVRTRAEPESDLETMLAEKTRQLQLVRSQRAQLRAQRTKVDRQLAELRARAGEMKEQVAAEQSLVERLERRARNAEERPAAQEEVIVTAAKGARLAMQDVRERIQAGAPVSRRERLDRVEVLLDRLSSADPIEQGEALVDAWSFLEEELRQARTIELRNEAVVFDDGRVRKDSYRVRIGLVGELLVAEDGSTVAVASSHEPDGWLRRLDAAKQSQVKRAVYVLRHQLPELVTVPFAVSPEQRDPVRLVENTSANSVEQPSDEDAQP